MLVLVLVLVLVALLRAAAVRANGTAYDCSRALLD